MRALILIWICLLAILPAGFAQQYQGDVTVSKDTLTFIIKPQANLTSKLSNVEFFLRWRKEDGDSIRFGNLSTNRISFPGLVIYQGHNDVDDSGYYNHHFAFTGGLLPTHYHAASRSYIVFQVVVEGRIPPTMQFVANNNTGVPYYFTVLGESADHTPYLPTVPLVEKSGSAGAFFYKNLFPNRPLDLLAISATSEDCRPKLTWQLKDVQQGNEFEVQQSFDNSNFLTVARVPNTTSSPGISSFEVLLPKINSPIYYRLQVANPDSSQSLSMPFYYHNDTCNGAEQLSLAVMQNPVVDHQLKIRVKASRQQEVKLRIVDAYGNAVKHHSQAVMSGDNDFVIQLPFLARGIYIVEARGRVPAKSKKFYVIQP